MKRNRCFSGFVSTLVKVMHADGLACRHGPLTWWTFMQRSLFFLQV